MSSSNVERLRCPSYILLGFLLGFLISYQYLKWDMLSKSGEETKIVQYIDDDFKESIKSAVRDEIHKQIGAALVDFAKNNAAVAATTSNNEQQVTDILQNSEGTKSTNLIYDQANHMLDEALASGGFDRDSAKRYVSYLRSLPIAQEIAIRAKYSNAINMGLITATESPDALAAQALD